MSSSRLLRRSHARAQLRDARFRYPSRRETEVLKGLSLELRPGKVAALVGPSGGGKSTVCHLIEAFYYVNDGAILFDGVNIKDLDPRFLHDQISIVSQEPSLFATSPSSPTSMVPVYSMR